MLPAHTHIRDSHLNQNTIFSATEKCVYCKKFILYFITITIFYYYSRWEEKVNSTSDQWTNILDVTFSCLNKVDTDGGTVRGSKSWDRTEIMRERQRRDSKSQVLKYNDVPLPAEPTRTLQMFLCRRSRCPGSLNEADLRGSCASVVRFLQKSNYYLQFNKVTALFLGMKGFYQSHIVRRGAQVSGVSYCVLPPFQAQVFHLCAFRWAHLKPWTRQNNHQRLFDRPLICIFYKTNNSTSCWSDI